MLPYFVLILVPLILAILEINGKRNSNSIFYLILFVLIVGGTDGNGLDWFGTNGTDGYAFIDYRGLGYDDLINFEPGFVFVNKLLGKFHIFLLLMSFTCYLLVWGVIKQECKYKFIGLFVFIASMTLYCYMGVYRHAIAQTLIIYSWKFRNSRKLQSLILFMACLFHYSAIIAFLYLFIPKNKIISIKVFILLLVLGVLIRSSIMPILSVIAAFMPGNTANKFDYYIATGSSDEAFSITLLLFRIFTFLLAYYYINKKSSRDIFFVNTFAISIILYVTICISPSFGRMIMFFSCTEIILIPLILERTKEKILLHRQNTSCRLSNNKYYNFFNVYFYLFVILYLYQYFNYLIGWRDIYIPYNSILI